MFFLVQDFFQIWLKPNAELQTKQPTEVFNTTGKKLDLFSNDVENKLNKSSKLAQQLFEYRHTKLIPYILWQLRGWLYRLKLF